MCMRVCVSLYVYAFVCVGRGRRMDKGRAPAVRGGGGADLHVGASQHACSKAVVPQVKAAQDGRLCGLA